jgi:hypothetical protein
MICVFESCSAAAEAAAGPAALVTMSRAVLLVNCSCCGTDIMGPLVSKSSKLIGAVETMPRQPDTGAQSLTAQHSAARHSTAQHSTAQHSTARHGTTMSDQLVTWRRATQHNSGHQFGLPSGRGR